MAKFDPKRHRVVAVPFKDDDPEKGQHFHVDLDDLVDASVAAMSEDGGEVNPFLIKRIESIEARLTEQGGRVDGIENRPHVSEETLKQLDDGLNAKIKHLVEKHVNSALGDLRQRLIALEKAAKTITHEPGEPQSSQVAKLADAIHSFGKYVSTVESDLEARVAAVEQIHAELAENITDNNLKLMKVNTRLYKALKALEYDEAAA